MVQCYLKVPRDQIKEVYNMCGIAGQISMKNGVCLDVDELEKMLQLIVHRGPDGKGIYEDVSVIFGMRRLSIIDLNTGWQPLYNENKTFVCCCNGELYNYKELKRDLIQRGHHFRTESDIEIIPHLYEEYGELFIEKVNGMFSIALWDSLEKRMLLYRDRLGKKPLYYMESNNILYFASEIKSILTCRNVKRKCNLKALDYLLTYNYIPNHMTAFDNIYKLMPGHYMVIQNGSIQDKEYWDIPIGERGESKNFSDEGKILEHLNNLLEDSTKIRLRSDVPVGAFLSGGVDSSIVVANASKFVKGIKTFSIGFKEQRFNELPYSRAVSELYGTKNIEEIVDSQFFDLLPATIWLNDNPHGDVSFLPTYVLSRLTAKHVKTVLTGDGGDELFGGYSKYLDFTRNNSLSYADFFENTSVFDQAKKKSLYTDSVKAHLYGTNCVNYINEYLNGMALNPKDCDRLNILLYLETKLLLEGNNLVKPDRMGLGNSVEARMPLLDYRLVEYVFSLPSHFKIRDGETKYILKKASILEGIPKEIIYRDKQMFTVPVGEWLKKDLRPLAYSILMDERTSSRDIFERSYVNLLLEQHMSGKANYTRQLRLLIIIELWFRIFIDNFYETTPTLSQLM